MTCRMSDRQIRNQIVVAPGTDARAFVRTDVEGAPARRDRAAEFLAVVERERQISRRVALTTMRQGFCEISAPVPFRALRRVGSEPYVWIEQRRPEHHSPARV